MRTHFLSYCLWVLAFLFLFCAFALEPISIATIACGKKAKFHLPSFLQSLLLQPLATRKRIKLFVFGDDDMYRIFVRDPADCLYFRLAAHFHSVHFGNISSVAEKFGGGLSLLSKHFPEDIDRYQCAAFKLDMADMVPTEKRVMYMDADMIVFDDLARLYDYFEIHANKTLLLTRESYHSQSGWYFKASARDQKGAKRHYYPPTGVNSGLVLMNLEKMRHSSSREGALSASAFLSINTEKITMGDQDVLNSFCHHYPHEVAILPCKYNRRSDSHCEDGDLDLGLGLDTVAPSFPGVVKKKPLSPEEAKYALQVSRTGILHANRRIFFKHLMYPLLHNLHRNYTDAFLRVCNLSHEIVSWIRGNSVYIK